MSVDADTRVGDLSPEELFSTMSNVVGEAVEDKTEASLKPKTPKEAVDKYFESRDFESEATSYTQSSSLYNFFVPWCESRGIKNVNDLDGDLLSDYRVWRRDESSDEVDKLSPKTEESQQKILSTFIKHCETFSAVRPNLHNLVFIPDLDDEDEVREVILNPERAKKTLDWLEKYEYASADHAIFTLFASAGLRVGAINSLDLTDVRGGDNGPFLNLEHRPSTGTSLKNGKKSDRHVAIDDVHEVITDFMTDRRPSDITDDHGREPLFATKHGRMAKSTIRQSVYAWTRPCKLGEDCPVGKDPEDCRGAQRRNWASQCEESVSCHPVRKGYITAELNAQVPRFLLSERCDVSEKIIDKHYDLRTAEEKMAARKSVIDSLKRESPRYGD